LTPPPQALVALALGLGQDDRLQRGRRLRHRHPAHAAVGGDVLVLGLDLLGFALPGLGLAGQPERRRDCGLALTLRAEEGGEELSMVRAARGSSGVVGSAIALLTIAG